MAMEANVVVAKDGSGKYDSVAKAVADVPEKNTERFVIYIKAGVYNERVEIPKGANNVTLIGEGPTNTVITNNVSVELTEPKPTTFNTATVAVNANNFICKEIGIENTAGPEGHQAVALRVSGDNAAFHNCHFKGYQDTLYSHKGRQFYRDCLITGTIDFVFGDARAVYQNCKLMVRKPMENQSNIFIAQGRKSEESTGGFVFHNCTFTAEDDYLPVKDTNKTYLNRPWKDFATVVILQCQIDDVIQPEAYIPMDGEKGLATSYYVEFGNRGPGANTDGRAKWPGIKQVDENEAKKFTPGVFLESETWITNTGIPCTPDMIDGV